MIGSLRGSVLGVDADGTALVEAGGVGYVVQLHTRDAVSLTVGDTAFLHVHTHVREDAIVLYGFTDREERVTFQTLLATHGVGPSLALGILSVLPPATLRQAVDSRDAEALLVVPGVGPKTAARLLLELEARLPVLVGEGSKGTPSPVPVAADRLGEVRAALGVLGYGAEEVRAAMRSVPQEGPVEELLRAALRELAGVR